MTKNNTTNRGDLGLSAKINDQKAIRKEIKLFYEDKEYGIAIYKGNCLDVLPMFPEKSIDMVLTDPP